MTKPPFNLDREFVQWYHHDDYSGFGTTREAYAEAYTGMTNNWSWWMRAAFKAGAEAMWDEVNYTLAQYACACEGLDPELITPAEVFDRARENLHSHVAQLELFDDV